MSSLSGVDVAPSSTRGTRIAAVDALRGVALLGMVAYHVVWDLQAFGLSTIDPVDVTALRWLGNTVAGTFLLISGVSLTLAERACHSWWQKLGRIALLALAAGAVTLITWLAWPDIAVRFGILHCLVATNMIGLLLGRVPNALLLFAAAFSVVMPLCWPWPLGEGWAWIGLSRHLPATLDFRPVLPWLALVLVGMTVGRSVLMRRLAKVHLGGAVARSATFAGRHSLAIYLLHQPVLLAGLGLITIAAGIQRPVTGPIASSQAAAFLTTCTQACSAKQDESLCRATCHCVLTASAVPEVGVRGLLARVQDPQAKLRRALEACRSAVSNTVAGPT